ncbi:hypothetical protein [Bradyrhizobium sp. SSUT77]|uniref:hypothetical protein n=1 Tax=Bradyrhizobium sp. SSUT77 TaxID=3040603 RepID=UPI00244AA46E|nr:hypothetical protein [Bradyrhizobium sp. SSUT77]MDH2343081.1 hypothetical protein [Bradyrhizobium sp. SSUT77]
MKTITLLAVAAMLLVEIFGPKSSVGVASSQHPLKYVVVAAIAIVMVVGSWMPLWAVNRFRD